MAPSPWKVKNRGRVPWRAGKLASDAAQSAEGAMGIWAKGGSFLPVETAKTPLPVPRVVTVRRVWPLNAKYLKPHQAPSAMLAMYWSGLSSRSLPLWVK